MGDTTTLSGKAAVKHENLRAGGPSNFRTLSALVVLNPLNPGLLCSPLKYFILTVSTHRIYNNK